jgi:HEAT repeat protein
MKTWRDIGGVVVLAFLFVTAQARTSEAQGVRSEQELIAVLRSDAPESAKAIACKDLAVYGSSECVAELAKLLSNEHLSSWARTPLEAIPGSAADEALRKATESLQGRLLVGVINSIGVRRDAGAVQLLTKQLENPDAEVASAAAVALGRIGGSEVAGPLRQSLTKAPANVRSAVAEGCVLVAERFLAGGNSSEATKIYDEVRKAEVPRQRMLEATRGAILARGKDGIPLLLEQLRSDDKGLFQIGLMAAREIQGRDVDQALAAEVERAFPERAALVIAVMADRTQTVDRAAILKAVSSSAKPVRLAAIAALGRVGDGSSLAALLDAAVDTDAELSQAAKESLAALPGDSVDKEIAARLAQASGKTYPLLIELVGKRHIDAVPALLKALEHSDQSVRHAALTSLGATVDAKYLSVLISAVVTPKSSEEAPVALAALKSAATRMPDRDACASELAAAADRSPLATKTTLLEVIGAVGGAKALDVVSAAAKDADATLQDVGSRLLGDWPNSDAAPVLLSLAKSGGRFQTRALRGYIGMAQKFIMPDEQRAQMCRNALEAARQPDERKLVFDVLRRNPNVEMLKLAVNAMQVPLLKEDATAAAQAIAQRLPKTDEVRALLARAGLEK